MSCVDHILTFFALNYLLLSNYFLTWNFFVTGMWCTTLTLRNNQWSGSILLENLCL